MNPAISMAMTVIDLLHNDAQTAKRILDSSRPTMTKSQYLSFQNSRLTEELYEGV